jgi:SAM-dependent methyltransferase
MQKKTKKDLSREIGLEIGSICGKYFLKLDHLHYGYWTDDIQVNIANLYKAQDEYVKFILSNIPANIRTILDVGCGTGHVAKMLIERGYQVDCVSPSSYLNSRVKALLGDKCQIYECFYQDLLTTSRYDMILFSESFQYIDVEQALSKTVELLNKDGFMLICDFFKRETQTKGAMSGGHKLSKFYDIIQKFPLELLNKIDITNQTAPNMDIVNDIMTNVVQPIVAAGEKLAVSRYPTAVKLLKWKYRKQINKLHGKYFEGGRTGEEFKKYKLYQMLLYRKIAK